MKLAWLRFARGTKRCSSKQLELTMTQTKVVFLSQPKDAPSVRRQREKLFDNVSKKEVSRENMFNPFHFNLRWRKKAFSCFTALEAYGKSFVQHSRRREFHNKLQFCIIKDGKVRMWSTISRVESSVTWSNLITNRVNFNVASVRKCAVIESRKLYWIIS